MTTTFEAAFVAPDDADLTAPLLRKTISLDRDHGAIVRASMRVSALGVIEAYIDGAAISEDLLTPGWTSYEWRLRYAEYDVLSHLENGTLENGPLEKVTLSAVLGNGWFRGRLGFGDGARPYGQELAALLELRIAFEDGHEQVVGTDPSWMAGPSSILSNSLYDGQTIDGRVDIEAVMRTGEGGGDGWGGTHVVDVDPRKLVPYVSPPVRRQYSIVPVDMWTTSRGTIIVDYGKNVVGWVRVKVTGSVGSHLILRHAEVLEHGELGTRPLRTAKATDEYILSGRQDVFEPRFTFHGFRYVELEGWPHAMSAIQPGDLEAVVISSDLARIGQFECSDPLLNQLHQNVVTGMQGNFVDIPTDCPQRDERLGWTGDIAAFAPTASFLFDVRGFLQNWLTDLALEQRHHDGVVPFVVPDVLKYIEAESVYDKPPVTAIWSDAAAWVPWAMWEAYGETDTLRDAFPSMTRHARVVQDALSDRGVWEEGFQFGDWLDPDAPPEDAAAAKADPGVVASACAYRTARIVAETSAILGYASEAEEFTQLAARIKTAFNTVYVDGDRIVSDCPTVYSLAIVFGLLDEEQVDWAGRRLSELVVASGHHISTGFAGTPFIMDALSSTGHVETAYRLLLQKECPSWLYPVTQGATTIWERWDSMLPDGSINPGGMTSFNHYALGAVADWMHRVLGGLAPLEPGYRRILIAPITGDQIEWAKTSLKTPHGVATVQWERRDREIAVTVTLPFGTTGTFRVPGRNDVELGPGTHSLQMPIALRVE
ncbi:alpha-L-rhamnosidase [Microbacterium sp. W4I20]|uniref:alpha-L-rhamnosidase n=1 Tax=Microbacterium sp. W4I20 TaxID=3042262 RepID=UPI002784CE3F|nr:alpha-L-rhamnosidase [Microbacterium sp. W4I20]MDQ0726723.1 alpha-L-rhamnosidase [Microbacterium sp. W4I20]